MGLYCCRLRRVDVLLFVSGTFIWTSQHYDWVVASFVLVAILLIVALVSAIAFVVVRRGYNNPPLALQVPQRTQWWLEPAVLATGLDLGRTIGIRRILPCFSLAHWASGGS